MKLQALSTRTGTSIPSIKYYLRLGLLPPGHKKNATTAVYDDSHVERLELIAALRQILDVPIAGITDLVRVIDDPEVPVLSVMQAAQELAIGITTPSEQPATDAATRQRVSDMMAARGWPDRPSVARTSLECLLAQMSAMGLVPSDDYLARLARAVETISVADLDFRGSRDRVAMRVAVGTHQYSRLVVATLQLGQTSASIARFSDTPSA